MLLKKNSFDRNWLLLLLLGIIWGLAFVSVEASLRSFSPLQIACLRILIGTIMITSFTFFWERNKFFSKNFFSKKIIFFSIGVAVFSNALPFSLLSWAQIYVTSIFAGVFMTLVPLIILPLAHFFIPNEKLSFKKVLGFLLGFIGVMILIDVNLIMKDLNSDDLFPKLACFGATISYAVGSIIIKRSPKTSQLVFSSLSLFFASFIMLFFLILNNQITFNSEIKIVPVLGILFLGAFPTGVATVLKVSIIKNAGPSFLSLVNYQVPLWAIIFGFLFFNEKLPKEIVIGLILIIIGLFVSQSNVSVTKRLIESLKRIKKIK